MLFERIESEGIAHYSYLLGDQGEALVIDPRRDIDAYIQKASRAGYRLLYVLETHRNEDYLVGSVELAARLGAQIWHADSHLDYHYGKPVKDGQTWPIGRLKIEAMLTPGHTLGSMSYLLYDSGEHPWMVFTGDLLFADDVGRVDLLGMNRAPEMAAMLNDSIFKRLLKLGDHIIVCPAHGAGSLCGGEIGRRPWTTIGIERRHNPKLQSGHRAEFIRNVTQKLERPPYFAHMEELNLAGAPILRDLPVPQPLAPEEFAERAEAGIILDTRMEVAFGAAHIPGAISIWAQGLPEYAGWFLPYDRPILLITEDNDPLPVVRSLVRLGFDNLGGTLGGGMLSWHLKGLPSGSIRTMTVQELCLTLDHQESPWILDVRSEQELRRDGRIPNAVHIHLTQLPEHLDLVTRRKRVHIFCGSGLRSMTAASILKRNGWHDVAVVLGGLAGWNSISCPIDL